MEFTGRPFEQRNYRCHGRVCHRIRIGRCPTSRRPMRIEEISPVTLNVASMRTSVRFYGAGPQPCESWHVTTVMLQTQRSRVTCGRAQLKRLAAAVQHVPGQHVIKDLTKNSLHQLHFQSAFAE
jgi:hypothetical protein